MGKTRGLICVVLLLSLAACKCGSDGAPDLKPDAYELVKSYAAMAFEVQLDLETDRAAIQRFLDATAGAGTAADLTAAWTGVPATWTLPAGQPLK